MTVDGSLVTQFIRVCTTLEEAQRSAPTLTQEQFDAIRSNRARIVGDSNVGFEYVEGEE